MSPKTPKLACPLPISTTQTARGLLRIYSRLKGELVKARTGEDVMVQSDEAQRVMEHNPAWPPGREAAARALPGIADVLAGPHSNQTFISRIQGIFNWSKSQDPECRHYVQLKSSISDAVQSDRARLMVENYFYKAEVRR